MSRIVVQVLPDREVGEDSEQLFQMVRSGPSACAIEEAFASPVTDGDLMESARKGALNGGV